MRVKGDADAHFLPIPTFTFTNIEVGANPSAPIMSAARVKVRVELLPLLQQEIDVIDMDMEAPQMSLRIAEDGTSNWALDGTAASLAETFDLNLGPVNITNGSIYFANVASDISVIVREIDAMMTAQSLLGPWKMEGRGLEDRGEVDFKISTGKFSDGNLRTKVFLQPIGLPFDAVFDGNIAFANEDGEPQFPTFKGLLKLDEVAREVEADSGDVQSRRKADGWRLEGNAELDKDKFLVTQATFEDGARETPLNLFGTVRVPFTKQTRFDAVVSSRQIDLDRVYGKGPKEPIKLADANRVIVDVLKSLPKPPIPGQIGVEIPGIVVAGDVIRAVNFDAEPSDDGWKIQDFAAQLPGTTNIRLSGDIDTTDSVRFEGSFDIVSERPVAFARWWQPAQAQALRRLRIGSYDLRGKAVADSDELLLSDLTLNIADSDLNGSVAFSRLNNERNRFDADLTAKRLDFDAVQVLAAMFIGDENIGGFGPKDTVSIKLEADTFIAQSIEGQDADLDLRVSDGEIDINDLRIREFAGAQITASGKISKILTDPTGRFAGRVSADNIDGVIKVAESFFPDRSEVKFLRAHGSSLVPLNLDIGFIGEQQEGDANIVSVSVKGQVGSGDVDSKIRMAGDFKKPYAANIDAKIDANHQKTADFFRQLAVPIFDVGDAGDSNVTITANGKLADGLEIKTDALISDVSVKSDLKVVKTDDKSLPQYTGTISAQSQDIEPLTQLLGYTVPAMGLGIPLDVRTNVAGVGWNGSLKGLEGSFWEEPVKANLEFKGDTRSQNDAWDWTGNIETSTVSLAWLLAFGTGETLTAVDDITDQLIAEGLTGDPSEAEDLDEEDGPLWPQRVYGKPYLERVNADISVAAKEVFVAEGYDLEDAVFDVRLRPDEVAVSNIQARYAQGDLTGRFAFQNANGSVQLSGNLDLSNARADDLLWQADNRPLVDGKLSLTSQFEGVGRSFDAIIASLGGGGTIGLKDARIRKLNPATFRTIVDAADKDLDLTQETLAPLISSYLDAGVISILESEVPFSIGSGAVRIANTNIDTVGQGEVETLASAELDLGTLSLDASMALNVESDVLDDTPVTGAVPEIAVLFEGDLFEPERTLDIQPLLGYLTVRKFEQEVRRVERLQADILEKQRLSRYARWISAEEEREQREAEEAERRRQEQIRLQREEEERKAEQERQRQAAIERQRREEAERKEAEERARAEREALARAIAEQEAQEAELRAAEEQARLQQEQERREAQRRRSQVDINEQLNFLEQSDIEEQQPRRRGGAPLQLVPNNR